MIHSSAQLCLLGVHLKVWVFNKITHRDLKPHQTALQSLQISQGTIWLFLFQKSEMGNTEPDSFEFPRAIFWPTTSPIDPLTGIEMGFEEERTLFMHVSCPPKSFWGQSHSARMKAAQKENVFTMVIALYKVIFWFSRFWLWKGGILISCTASISPWTGAAPRSPILIELGCTLHGVPRSYHPFGVMQQPCNLSNSSIQTGGYQAHSKFSFKGKLPKPTQTILCFCPAQGLARGTGWWQTPQHKARQSPQPATDGDGKLPGKRLHGITKMHFIYLPSDMRLWPCLWGENPDMGWT